MTSPQELLEAWKSFYEKLNVRVSIDQLSLSNGFFPLFVSTGRVPWKRIIPEHPRGNGWKHIVEGGFQNIVSRRWDSGEEYLGWIEKPYREVYNSGRKVFQGPIPGWRLNGTPGSLVEESLEVQEVLLLKKFLTFLGCSSTASVGRFLCAGSRFRDGTVPVLSWAEGIVTLSKVSSVFVCPGLRAHYIHVP